MRILVTTRDGQDIWTFFYIRAPAGYQVQYPARYWTGYLAILFDFTVVFSSSRFFNNGFFCIFKAFFFKKYSVFKNLKLKLLKPDIVLEFRPEIRWLDIRLVQYPIHPKNRTYKVKKNGHD